MSPVLVAVLVALLSALALLAVTARTAGSSRGLLSDLRSGLRRGDPHRPGLLAAARRDLHDAAEVEPGGLEELFALGGDQQDDDVRVDGLTDSLTRVTERAARGVSGLVRR